MGRLAQQNPPDDFTAPIELTSGDETRLAETRSAFGQAWRSRKEASRTLAGSTCVSQPGAHAESVPQADVEALQQANPAPPRDGSEQNGWWKKFPLLRRMEQRDIMFGFAVVWLLIVFVIAVVVAFSLRVTPNDGPTADARTAHPALALPNETLSVSPTMVPSYAPTMPPTTSLEAFVVSILPDATGWTIKNDQNSPQAKAFDFVVEDSALSTYPAWRIIQRFALATFYYATGGDGWKENDDWLKYESHECEWFHQNKDRSPCGQVSGVHAQDGGRYEHLWLRDNGILGSLPAELFLLTALKTIDLDMSPTSNHGDALIVSNEIPTEIGLCSSLESLSLVHFKLRTVPSEILQLNSLRLLNLSGNLLPTSVLPELLSLGSLTALNLSQNWLTQLPTSFGQLSRLETLDMSSNRFSTQVLTSVVAQLTSLKVLSLHSSGLLSTMPSELGLMSSLEKLLLNDNELTGTIPNELWSLVKAGNLSILHMENNQFFGEVPDEVCTIVANSSIFDCNDLLCGCDCLCIVPLLPASTVGMIRSYPTSPQARAFQWVNADPYLHDYPDWRIQQRFALATFYLATGGDHWSVNRGWMEYGIHECQWHSGESYTSSFHSFTTNHSNSCDHNLDDPYGDDDGMYRHFWLQDDQLIGRLPPELFLLTSLQSINLRFGEGSPLQSLPSELGLCTDLESISFSGLKINVLPQQMNQLTSLRHLSLKNNRLTTDAMFDGIMAAPLSLGLKTLDLSHNIIHRFSSVLGQFPKLENLDMSSNIIRSRIPPEVGHMHSLRQLWAHDNFLMGIPSEIGALTSLEQLLLDNNQIEGTIPMELESLVAGGALTTLRLDVNKFSGHVPEELCTLGTANFTFDCGESLCGCSCVCT